MPPPSRQAQYCKNTRALLVGPKRDLSHLRSNQCLERGQSSDVIEARDTSIRQQLTLKVPVRPLEQTDLFRGL